MLLIGDDMKRKMAVTYITWYYLSNLFLKNQNEILELDVEKILKIK